MKFSILTLFPEMFQALQAGIIKKAMANQLIQIDLWNPRDFAQDKHQCVDDRPYGGGPGMVMMAEPLQAALQAAKKTFAEKPTVIYLSPQGRRFNQEAAIELVNKPLILLAGRYEGIDERIIQQEIDEEWSVGDYILTGGELAAMVMIDAMARLIPGVVGDEESVMQDSLSSGLLKYPQYTRPEIFNELSVPKVLLSGHHEHIRQWRLKESLGKTWLKRPDLLEKKSLTKEEIALLTEFIEEFYQAKG
ncbi:MAG: tRNA (guanosine(37)-N1)-methyltransferase TrmD [Gammaproteobacteria bacterium]|nr:tRNA (guanosine(37)-N1)-methyltransferase TrmD [Gammaproteobacteria bacterium]